jgi:hypothetical protein
MDESKWFNSRTEDNMNTQERINDNRTFRIAVIAVAAAVLLAVAAYLYGAGLRADTSASVAPSPLGSSLTAVREARAVAPSALGAYSTDARGARTILSAARAAALAALAKSRSDFYADLNNSAAASRWAAVAAHDVSLARFYGAVNATNAAAAASSPAGLSAPGQSQWIKPEGIKASGAAGSAADQYQWIKPEGIEASGTK